MTTEIRILHIRGFTLIELLVVIAIIGLLSSVVLASLNSARNKAADAAIQASMFQIRNALELYYNDYGHYPLSGGLWTSFDSPAYSPNPISTPNAANLTAALASYIGKVTDPQTAVIGNDAGYLYTSGTGTEYCILVYKIPRNMNDFKSNLIPPRCGSISNGQCTSGANSVYIGTGGYAAGC